MIDPTKTTPEKLAEMNDSLLVDNAYLRQQLAETEAAPKCGRCGKRNVGEIHTCTPTEWAREWEMELAECRRQIAELTKETTS